MKALEKFKEDTYAKLLGMSITKVSEGYAEVEMTLTDDMLNFHGSANGGAIFSLADAAFAYASNSHGQTAVGITMTTHFVSPAKSGDKLTAVASEDNKSSRLGLYRIEVKDEAGTLVSLSEGMVYRKNENFV
ncbi:hydroxyphenylacetyl-CoA thioesterase PaaI [Bacillus sp. FJAT-45350]|uniref:hydroxyphenylacetyl-CoA thioesterase PaaI n=1 Tax=Bacillus sp. FJAT-45350 TaxID=2011014 RepID=UPI000BB798C9|nr:hydroxyphenylacetyl-CoA thioesterase PaaI [Bacillus sp. FJAT-45350]